LLWLWLWDCCWNPPGPPWLPISECGWLLLLVLLGVVGGLPTAPAAAGESLVTAPLVSWVRLLGLGVEPEKAPRGVAPRLLLLTPTGVVLTGV